MKVCCYWLQGASGIIFPIIKAEGVRQMFFPATVAAYYRAPPPQWEVVFYNQIVIVVWVSSF